MFYIGVDIAKNNHEASIIDSDGKLVSESFSFSNSIRGLEKFQKFISSFSIDSNNCIIGMEATGHYWLSLYSFLIDLGFSCIVINPIQSDAFRKMYIRQTKNDSVDSFVIAQILRFGEFPVFHRPTILHANSPNIRICRPTSYDWSYNSPLAMVNNRTTYL